METFVFFRSLYRHRTIPYMVLPKQAGEPQPQQTSLLSADNASARFQGADEGFSRQKDTLKAAEEPVSSSLQTDEPLLLLEVTLMQRLMYLKPQSPFERC